MQENATVKLYQVGSDPSSLCKSRLAASHRRGVPGSALLKELWQYVKKEKDLQSKLDKEEYECSFWTWACGFLKEDPAPLLESGSSVVGTIRDEINGRLRIANRKDWQHGLFETASSMRHGSGLCSENTVTVTL